MADNKHENILMAAQKLFAERGYDGTTVPMIAEEARVGAGTIYRYFENKQMLVNELFRGSVARFAATLHEGFPEQNDFRKRFRHVFYRLVRYSRENPEAFRFINAAANAYFLDEVSKSDFEGFMDFIERHLDEGKKAGLLRGLPAQAFIAIVYGTVFHLSRMFEDGTLEPSDELLAGIEESCWDAVSAD
ncbi:TetR/AcrR family transcriptional regulator [Bhargavaea beijingensis]|uniref:TetR/AcrR family transcriptional regulator n=1 Tax=Bhargavaea beijingensis TaxID=426756 RepID=A0A1G6Y3R2_9BACL|nr:TetR/AcrR family transcriptional regulator [Bhargavaea beijingensis]MCW1927862.1 TetR family transcriptional regulator [Bhargavaea beijingensis]RSK31893.1 TetR/AcrR family transcriptional regulator [Bhargavaea beijingensis]SDD84942.1 transcriptional regulator, TetR family [Bhargavaea beijingensis]